MWKANWNDRRTHGIISISSLYHRQSELIVKYNIGLKTLLQQGISEPIFYGDLVYNFKRIVGKPSFSDQLKKIVKRYIRVGYNLDIMRQSACMPNFKPNHGLYLWFPLQLNDGGSGLRLYYDSDVKL